MELRAQVDGLKVLVGSLYTEQASEGFVRQLHALEMCCW